jgi:hypothetical protein
MTRETKVVVRPLEEDLDEIANAFRKVEERVEFREEKIVVDSPNTLRKHLRKNKI